MSQNPFRRYILTENGPEEIGEDGKDLDLIPELESTYGIELDHVHRPSEEHRLNEYLDAAKEELHIGSDRKLAQALNVAPSTIVYWRDGRTVPGETTMMRIAQIAREDPDEALILQRMWLAKSPDAKNIYLTLLSLVRTIKMHAEAALPVIALTCYQFLSHAVPGTILSALIVLGSLPAWSAGHSGNKVTSISPEVSIMRQPDIPAWRPGRDRFGFS